MKGRPAAPAAAETGGVELAGYQLQQLLAVSSRYEVFQAWSEDRSAAVAVKRARPSAGPTAGQKLLEEGHMLSGLTHPNLLRLYETHAEPVPTLVLELLTGPSIADLFDVTGILPYPDVVEMGRQVAAAVGYLHRRGLLHADLKPGNVIAEHGRATVIDLSLARPPGRYEPAFGTQRYLSPEQAQCQPVDAAADVWGLGILLLESASGRDGFPPGCAEYRDQHGPVAAPPPRRFPRGVPVEFVELIMKCTAFEPASRPSLSDVFTTLNALAEATHGEKRQRGLRKLSSRPVSPGR
jgi:eukaryotic-like serine/threonine-protein kinase